MTVMTPTSLPSSNTTNDPMLFSAIFFECVEHSGVRMNELNVVTLLIEHMFYCRHPVPPPRAPLAEPGPP
jgi:hypothetical protein